jgi:hypothetical protein
MDDYVTLDIIEDEIEASLLESILEERDIPHQIISFHDTAFNGLFQTQKGWGKINAPSSYHHEIREILSDVRKTR